MQRVTRNSDVRASSDLNIPINTTGGNSQDDAVPKFERHTETLEWGDIVCLELAGSGFMVADAHLCRLGVEPTPTPTPSLRCGPFQRADLCFKLCPKLKYRAWLEVRLLRLLRVSFCALVLFLYFVVVCGVQQKRHVEANAELSGNAEFALLDQRLLAERMQNEEILAHATARADGDDEAPLLFGDVLQLLHLSSRRFVCMSKIPAPTNPQNCSVSLAPVGGDGPHCQFRIAPRFKVRSKGSVVSSLDEVVFESCESPGTCISASTLIAYDAQEVTTSALPTDPLPRVLRYAALLEVNGWMRPRGSEEEPLITDSSSSSISWIVMRFASARTVAPDQRALTTAAQFRFFHAELEGYLVASSCRDKSNNVREGGLPAHLLYCKKNTEEAAETAKGVWSFEPATGPFSTEVVTFNTPLRIKHVASNKYLSVFRGESSEASYECILVDAEDAGSPESLLFSLSSSSSADGSVNSGVTSIILEHFHDGLELFFSCADEPKPLVLARPNELPAPSRRGMRCGFGAHARRSEVLKIMPISEPDEVLMHRVLGYVPFVSLYAYRFRNCRNRHESLLKEVIPLCEPLVRMLMDLLADLTKGQPQWISSTSRTIADYCNEANAISVTELTEKYAGDGLVQVQNVCCETKLLDALIDASLAPYNRVRWGKSPFSSAEERDLPMAAQKFIYLAIQRIVGGNPKALNFFLKRTSPVWKESNAFANSPWRELLVPQSLDGAGATVLLALLFRSSKDVHEKLFSDSLLEQYKNWIQRIGPKRRLINFFASMCVLEDSPVIEAQEACVRKLWFNEDDRYSVFLSLHKKAYSRNSYKPVILPNGKEADPATRFFYPCCVVWKSSATVPWGNSIEWEMDRELHELSMRPGLYWAPKTLGLLIVGEHLDANGIRIGDYVPVEHFLYVLEPERLCFPVTGESFEKAKTESVGFKRLRSLAEYLLDQLALMNKMCLGRSANVIGHIRKAYPPDMLQALATNVHLPYVFRGSVLELAYTLYVDVSPQTNLAVLLPHRLWVYDDDSVHNDEQLPLVRKVALNHKSAFATAKSSPDSFLEQLKHICNEGITLSDSCITLKGAGNGLTGVAAWNQLTSLFLKGQGLLLDFGIVSTIDELQATCKASAGLLDGRGDLLSPKTPFEPKEARYSMAHGEAFSLSLCNIKLAAADHFFSVNKLATNFRLAAFLGDLKEHASAKKHADAQSVEAWAASRAAHTTFERMFFSGDKKQEAEAAGLDLAHLCGNDIASFEDTCLDLIMYQDDGLFANGLHLLESTTKSREEVVDGLRGAMLVESPALPGCFEDLYELKECVAQLGNLVSTYNSWGVEHRLIAGSFDDAKFRQCVHSVDRLLTFLYDVDNGQRRRGDSLDQPAASSSLVEKDIPAQWLRILRKADSWPNFKYQQLLRASSLGEVLSAATRMDVRIAFKGSNGDDGSKVESERRLSLCQRALMVLLAAYVSGNAANQIEVYDGSFVELTAMATANTKGIYQIVAEVLVATLRENEGLCLRLGEGTDQRHPLFDIFAAAAQRHACGVDVALELDFFFVACAPEGRFLQEFQRATCHVLLSQRFPKLAQALSTCVARCRTAALQRHNATAVVVAPALPKPSSPKHRRKSPARGRVSSASLSVVDLAAVPASEPMVQGAVEDPYRVVRLVTCVIADNPETASLVARGARGLNTSEVLDALTAHTQSLKLSNGVGGIGGIDGDSSDADGGDSNDLAVLWALSSPWLLFEAPATPRDAAAAVAAESTRRARHGFDYAAAAAPPQLHHPGSSLDGEGAASVAHAAGAGGGAGDLLALAVELLDLVPVPEATARAKSPLWRALKAAALPALRALAHPSATAAPGGLAASAHACRDLADFAALALTRVFTAPQTFNHAKRAVSYELTRQLSRGRGFLCCVRASHLDCASCEAFITCAVGPVVCAVALLFAWFAGRGVAPAAGRGRGLQARQGRHARGAGRRVQRGSSSRRPLPAPQRPHAQGPAVRAAPGARLARRAPGVFPEGPPPRCRLHPRRGRSAPTRRPWCSHRR